MKNGSVSSSKRSVRRLNVLIVEDEPVVALDLSAQHELSFPLSLACGVLGSVMADTIWYLIGRRFGHHVLRILCKLSLEPTLCVRKTQDSFGRRRGVMLLTVEDRKTMKRR